MNGGFRPTHCKPNPALDDPNHQENADTLSKLKGVEKINGGSPAEEKKGK